MLEKIVQYAPPALKKNKICRGLFGVFSHSINFGLDIIDSLRIHLYHRCHSSQLKKFKDIHKGERCFILGTGPSLLHTNLSLIKDEILFGVNDLCRGFEQLGISCKYYAISDAEILERVYKEESLSSVDAVLISHLALSRYLKDPKKYTGLHNLVPLGLRGSLRTKQCSGFSTDAALGVYAGTTVIYDICLQVAYYMGFSKVYLLGCDCEYMGLHYNDPISKQRPGWSEISEGWTKIFAAYRMSKKAYEDDGREIINATVGGKLEVFKRMKLEEII